MKRVVFSAGIVLGLLLFSQTVYAFHPYDAYSQNYRYCHYYNYAYWQPPQLICYPYPASPPNYLIQPAPVYHYYQQVQPPVVHYHIEISPPEIIYHLHQQQPSKPRPPEPVLPPAQDKETERLNCLNAGLIWLEAGQKISGNFFLPDNPEKRHEEHLQRLGRYNWNEKRFEELPKTVERYFGKETFTFTAPETGCYVRNQSGVMGKINIR